MTNKKPDGATAELNKVKTLDPKNATAYWKLGIGAAAKSHWDEAIGLFSKAIELDPTQGAFYDNRAVAYASKKDYAKAWEDVDAAGKLGYKLNPDFMKGLQNATDDLSRAPDNEGTKLVFAGKIDEALVQFNKAKTINPRSATAYWGLGVCASAKGQLDEAIAFLSKAIELNPSRGMFYDNRAVVYNSKKEYVNAWDDVNAAGKLGFQVNPNFIKGLQNATNDLSTESVSEGTKLMTAGKLDDAITQFNKAKTLNPRTASAYWGLGACACAKGQLDEAITFLNRAIELDPSQGTFYDNRAVAYTAKKEYARAWDDVHAAGKLGQKLNPDFIKDLQTATKEASQQPASKDGASA